MIMWLRKYVILKADVLQCFFRQDRQLTSMQHLTYVRPRGFNTADMDVVAQAIALLVDDVEKNRDEAMALVKTLTDKYPLYE